MTSSVATAARRLTPSPCAPLALAALLAASACGPRPSRPSSEAAPDDAAVHGIVRDAHGAPAADVTLIVTELSRGERTHVLRTDEHGRFQIDVLAAGGVAITALTADGYAWLEPAPIANGLLEIGLSSDCHRTRIEVEPRAAAGTTVHVSRHSSNLGDELAAAASASGHVDVCLPAARYRLWLEGASVALPAGLTVPDQPSLRVSTYPADEVRRPPAEATAAATTDVVVDKPIGLHLPETVRLLGLGEANHGSGDLITARAALTIDLVRAGFIHDVLFEADAITSLRADAYLAGEHDDPHEAARSLGFWVWDVEEIVAFLEELRRINDARADADKVRLFGVDVQEARPAAVLLASRGAPLGLTDVEATAIRTLATRGAASFRDLAQDAQASLLATLATLGDGDLATKLAATSLRIQFGHLALDGAALDGARDAGMAELTAVLLAARGPRRAVLFAHAGHVTREVEAGVPAMGHHLRQRLGDAYYPIGFYGGSGAVRAWDAPGRVGVVPHDLGEPPDYTLEAVLLSRNSSSTGCLDIAASRGPLRRWLTTPRFVRELGAAFTGRARTLILRSLDDAFDALCVLRHLGPSTPTATGVRMIAR